MNDRCNDDSNSAVRERREDDMGDDERMTVTVYERERGYE